MGTWGHGNLENDYALDELSRRTRDLLTPMFLRAQRTESRQYDEWDHTTLFVELEIVFALDKAGLLSGGLPGAESVRALAREFITEWEEYADGPHPARRKKIVQSFERLAEICEKNGGDGPLPREGAPAPRRDRPKPKRKRTARKRR